IQPPFQLFDLHLGNSRLHWLFLSADTAEFIVVDQLGDRRMLAARRAVGILAQLQFAEFHAQRVDQQEPPDERVACTKDQLDDLCRLHHPHEAGENSKHSAFGAGWNESRRWRLWIKTAIAWSFFGGEYAGLAFEAEDRSVHIGLAGEHAGVVHQIARGEVVGGVSNDVEVTEEIEGVLAGKPRL